MDNGLNCARKEYWFDLIGDVALDLSVHNGVGDVSRSRNVTLNVAASVTIGIAFVYHYFGVDVGGVGHVYTAAQASVIGNGLQGTPGSVGNGARREMKLWGLVA